MHLKNEKYSQKYDGLKDVHHSNLSTSLDSTIVDCSGITETMILVVLDQVTNFSIGTRLE